MNIRRNSLLTSKFNSKACLTFSYISSFTFRGSPYRIFIYIFFKLPRHFESNNNQRFFSMKMFQCFQLQCFRWIKLNNFQQMESNNNQRSWMTSYFRRWRTCLDNQLNGAEVALETGKPTPPLRSSSGSPLGGSQLGGFPLGGSQLWGFQLWGS